MWYNTPMTYKKEGYIPVDSGQIMLIDPCYIKSNFPNYLFEEDKPCQ